MAVERIEITSKSSYEQGRVFGSGGAYERIDAIVHYAVDPQAQANAAIVDLTSCVADEDGLVRFNGDMTLLRPVDSSRANRALLLELPNRGGRTAPRSFNRAGYDLAPTNKIAVGDGFLFERGWTLAWCGWQWDMPHPSVRLGLRAPMVPDERRAADDLMQLRIQPDRDTSCYPLTDHHAGPLGNHVRIAPGNLNDPSARLLVRNFLWAEPRELERSAWRFARAENGTQTPDPQHILLDGGFKAGRIYDLIYRPKDCPVVGAGLLAYRDLGAHLRYHRASPIAGSIDQVIGEGISQCGRFLRSFLQLGLNRDEAGEQVCDGLLIHIAGARRGEFNQRYGQPSVQPTPSFGHLFPYSDEPQTDKRTQTTAGLLDRQRALGCVPKIIYTDTSSEYWRGDASLAHTDVNTGEDFALPKNARRYLFAGTQHGQGVLPFAQQSRFDSYGANYFNVVDYSPLFRGALTNLLSWVAQNKEPPASCYPKHADGSAASREAVLEKLRVYAGMQLPRGDRLPVLAPLELGPFANNGVGHFPATRSGDNYPSIVSAIDADGNEIGGLRMPDLSVPVATHTGFNPRHPESGGAGQILEYLGTTLPMAANTSIAKTNKDPRVSISKRYANRDEYLQKIRAAALQLAKQRYIVDEDLELCVELAAARYDACMTESLRCNELESS